MSTKGVRTGKAWSEVELEALKTYYPRHGCGWEGWSEVLPERSKRSISAKAVSMGMVTSRQHDKMPKKMRHSFQPSKKRTLNSTADPMEGRIMSMLADGMTPSDIDKEMKWRPGRARMVITERWAREKGI